MLVFFCRRVKLINPSQCPFLESQTAKNATVQYSSCASKLTAIDIDRRNTLMQQPKSMSLCPLTQLDKLNKKKIIDSKIHLSFLKTCKKGYVCSKCFLEKHENNTVDLMFFPILIWSGKEERPEIMKETGNSFPRIIRLMRAMCNNVLLPSLSFASCVCFGTCVDRRNKKSHRASGEGGLGYTHTCIHCGQHRGLV